MSFENGGSPTTPQNTGPLFNTAPKKSSKTGDSLINDDDTPYVSRSRLCGQVAAPILQTEAPGILRSAVLGSLQSALINTAEGALVRWGDRGKRPAGASKEISRENHLPTSLWGYGCPPTPCSAPSRRPLKGSLIWVTAVPRPLLLVPLCPGVERSLQGPKNWKSRKPDAQLLG